MMNSSPTWPEESDDDDPAEMGCMFGCIGVIVCLIGAIVWMLVAAWLRAPWPG